MVKGLHFVAILILIAISKLKRRLENLRQRKETLLKKVYKLKKDYRIDITLILRQNG
jgi:hypothetical protein